MWVMTTRGFFSVVADRDDASQVLVRARVRQDLEALAEVGDLPEIAETPTADYRWRVRLSRAEWSRALARLAEEIAYPNFKDAVAERQGHEREGTYHRVWAVLRELQGR